MNRAEFSTWLEGYKIAWEDGDPSKILVLFVLDAIYEETPFGEPMRGHAAIRRYWEEGARDAQRGVAFTYEIYAVDGDFGLSRWHCVFERVSSDERVELDGIIPMRVRHRWQMPPFSGMVASAHAVSRRR